VQAKAGTLAKVVVKQKHEGNNRKDVMAGTPAAALTPLIEGMHNQQLMFFFWGWGDENLSTRRTFVNIKGHQF
jgi:hypothetical protein